MQDTVHSFILVLLARKSPLPVDFTDDSDFVSAGIVDSMAIIKFILELEARFDITLSDDDIASEQFRSVRGLVDLIDEKIA
ncbi:acyl carrier protein [Janthinobacterium psychrotolerans]|uniref:Acyl carrier protein n=1 Tax=Janthinobacterium psychrotolerans TaxID=1747903 RepID=A0A1A7C9F5_9BURK|nr:acyl carrier protein [Janthinobacterium psychrotolerans]OBV40943.1 Acyl carrier protein [Janthinobacterium psychrotolerans]